MPWKPAFPGEVPTLGYAMIDWYSEMLAHPDTVDYEPFLLYLEQEDWIINWYRINPEQNRRSFKRGVLGRPRGWGKSPLLGAMCIGEACGPVVFDGWDANGRPVGRPWKDFRKPLVHVSAVSEAQVANTWDPIMGMLREDAPIHQHHTAVPYDSYVDLGWGRIDKVTSSARTIKGAKSVFATMDQTEEWVPSNGGPNLATTIRSNCGKMNGSSVESPNAFKPGEGSVAELSFNYQQQILRGEALDEEGILYDHREAPPETDMSDHDSFLEGLRVSYGDSSNDPRGCVLHNPPCPPGHADLENNIRTCWAPDFDTQKARSDYLNQIESASDAWIPMIEMRKATGLWEELDIKIDDGETITLGFDGSRGRVRGNADATALVGCRLSDGAIFELKIWQAESHEKDWTPPYFEIDIVIAAAFEKYNVVGFFADPSGYTNQVAKWEDKYGRKLRAKATENNPIQAWPRDKNAPVVTYLVNLKQAIINGEVPIQPAPKLVSHFLNARMRKTRIGYLIYKAYPDSPDKIDGAYAAMLAYMARTKAIKMGVKPRAKVATSNYSGRVVIS